MSARGLGVRLLVVAGVLAGGALFAGVAQAGVIHPVVRSFGPEGFNAEGPLGAFSSVQSIAVDEASEDVYVYDAGAGAVYKFNSAGEPAGFSKLEEEGAEHPDVLTGVGGSGGGENELAVDSSASGPAKGDIYIANNSAVLIYASTGEKLEELSGGEACGVATDPAGHVYVGFYPGTVDEYTPVSNPVTNGDLSGSSTAALSSVCNVAADGNGNVYAATYTGGVARLEGLSAASATAVDEAGRTLAVDTSSGEVFVDEGSDIAPYSEVSGNLERGEIFGASGPGALSGSFGVAVNTATGAAVGEVYAGDGGVVEIYHKALTVPDTKTGGASAVELSGATLNGEVDPEGLPLISCQFEYGTEEGVYDKAAACASLPGPEKSFVAVSARVPGLQPNTLYHYRLVAVNANGDVVGEPASFVSFKAVPAVDDTAPFASGVTQLTATLNGAVDPNNAPASYHFVYGTTTAYGSSIPVPDEILSPGTTDQPVSQQLTGLTPGTVYHFALVAIGPGGQSIGPDETFQTPPVPLPTASTGTAGEITVGAATLTGSIDPQGWETTYLFQYGTTAAYGSQWPTIPLNLGALSGSASVLSYVQNLQPGTTYHYRLVATNPAGTVYGSDQAFTTASYPTSVVQEAPVIKTPLGINPETKPSSKTPKHKLKKKKAKRKTKRRKKG
jgi:hypothetical protein